ncbi:TetR/AcrR family transcriptional regulator [Streptomyces sp. NPDC004111]|uniref:TetR/AcrR family transcriptional regulator n=1 Tax=Streptomyces sp. NPDC004111 TaxID=3364690 RepID=UPI0036C7ACF9
MVRLSRAQQQEHTRAAVLAAARAEFAERGYAATKVDRIAERAELTRGAVYSNFPSKRALYLAVLVDLVEHGATDGAPATVPAAAPDTPPALASPASLGESLGAFARAWLERLPLTGEEPALGQVQLRSLTELLDDEAFRAAFGQVTRLEALLLALALEAREAAGAPAGPGAGTGTVRQVRRAELVLRLLDGPGASVDPALAFGDPFDVVQACAHLGGLPLADTWAPPHLPYVAPARVCRDPWAPPGEVRDLITGRPVDCAQDGVFVLLGSRRLAAAEEAVRAARPGDRVTVALATADPAETGRLVRLRIEDFTRCLRGVFAPEAGPSFRLVLDEHGLLASALGVPDADDSTEHAVRVRDGVVVARAHGRGAGHAAGTAGGPGPDTSRTAPPGTSRTAAGTSRTTPDASRTAPGTSRTAAAPRTAADTSRGAAS